MFSYVLFLLGTLEGPRGTTPRPPGLRSKAPNPRKRPQQSPDLSLTIPKKGRQIVPSTFIVGALPDGLHGKVDLSSPHCIRHRPLVADHRVPLHGPSQRESQACRPVVPSGIVPNVLAKQLLYEGDLFMPELELLEDELPMGPGDAHLIYLGRRPSIVILVVVVDPHAFLGSMIYRAHVKTTSSSFMTECNLASKWYCNSSFAIASI